MPYYARSRREFLHFTTHLPQHANICNLTIITGLKQTDYCATTVAETLNRI